MIVWKTVAVAGSFQTQHFAHYQNSVRDIVTEKKGLKQCRLSVQVSL